MSGEACGSPGRGGAISADVRVPARSCGLNERDIPAAAEGDLSGFVTRVGSGAGCGARVVTAAWIRLDASTPGVEAIPCAGVDASSEAFNWVKSAACGSLADACAADATVDGVIAIAGCGGS